MGKFFVPSTTRTSVDHVREALDKAERLLPNLRGGGPQVLELLRLFDQAASALAEFGAAGVDVRAERGRFETLERQLRQRQNRFLAEAGAALHEERASVQPDRVRWWWFLDEEVARQRVQRLRRALVWGLVVVLLLTGLWLLYDRFIAPPPQVRQALQRSGNGEALVEKGDLRAALAEFEAAAALTPDDPLLWMWQGVLHTELHEPDEARMAFETARGLYQTNFDFLLDRALAYLRAKDLAAASADVEQAIQERPDLGRGYYLRASVRAELGDYIAAVADLERAADLAQAAGDAQLEAAARVQRAMMMQLQMGQQVTPTVVGP